MILGDTRCGVRVFGPDGVESGRMRICAFRMTLVAGIGLLTCATAARQDPVAPLEAKIVILAGVPDDHPAGTHEYAKVAQLLAHRLRTARYLSGLRIETHLGGWPADPATFDDADTIVVISAGADRNEADHPLLAEGRLEILERAMRRGCGLVAIHWTTFVPRDGAGERFLEWIGGHFDYESGSQPNGWASKIQVDDGPAEVVAPEHPIARGVEQVLGRDEYYYDLRFRAADPRLTPILAVEFPDEARPGIVAWAVERAEGGRGFGFTGGHFQGGWLDEGLQRLVLNAIVWTARYPVPPGGVDAETERLMALIVTGHDHPAHDWRATTPAIREALERDPRWSVEVTEEPEALATRDLARFSTIVLNYCNWERPGLSADARGALLAYVQAGGGLSVVHFANGAFHPSLPGAEESDWPAYRETLVRRVWDHAPGASGHDAYGAFRVETTDVEHPITAGARDYDTVDELYYRQAGSAPIAPLVTARSKLTKQSEPLAWAYRVGQGRVFQTVLGHDAAALRVPGTARLVQRGTTWAAHAEPMDVEHPAPSVTRVTDDAPADAFVPDPAWTPAVAEGEERPAWAETEEEWVDDRFARMDTGPFFSGSIRTPGAATAMTARGVAIRVGEEGEGGVLFDTSLLRVSAMWTGPFLEHSPVRFGLLRAPKIGAPALFSTPEEPGWALAGSFTDPRGSPHAPLPAELARYRGLYVSGDRVVLAYTVEGMDVLESPWLEWAEHVPVFTRTLALGPSSESARILVGSIAGGSVVQLGHGAGVFLRPPNGPGESEWHAFALVGAGDHARLATSLDRPGRIELEVDAHEGTVRLKVLTWRAAPNQQLELQGHRERSPAPYELEAFLSGGLPRWPERLATRGELGTGDGAYVLDTLTAPYENPWGALLFTSGVDFLPNGDAAVATVHGDVWIVSGIDATLAELSWKRYATGLYQPLGLLVVDGDVIVTCRDRLTRLHDLDGNGEADFYESFCDLLEVSGTDHHYALDLGRDPDGNLYFTKSGNRSTAHGGAMVRIAPDGARLDVFATGFRHANGLAVGPDGTVTNADNQGEWVPATRLNLVREGGYYGYEPAYRGAGDPAKYDPPLLWLPHPVDNSAGGQAWVESERWGPLAGRLLHFSFGQCRMFLVLDETIGDTQQAGAVAFPMQFLSGVMRGRFRPQDGQLYACGSDGWQTAARADGGLQRVRYTGAELRMPVGLHTHANGLLVTFAEVLDPASVAPGAFEVARWNYHYSASYGSRRYSVERPDEIGEDTVEVLAATLGADGRSVFLEFPVVAPVMQMEVRYDVHTADGGPVAGTLYSTVHTTLPDFAR